MTHINFVMCCGKCRNEEECTAEDQQLGRVWKCSKCGVVTAHVYPQSGGRAWITVDPKEVEFYHLIKTSEDE